MFELTVIAVCLTLNALLAGLEMAFVAVPKPQLRQLAKSAGCDDSVRKDAQRILALRENPERTLSVIQIGITLVGAIASAIGGAGATESLTPLLQQRFGWSENTAEAISIIGVVLPITYLSVVFGELVPKTLSLRNPLRISLRGARWLAIADRALSPAVSVLEASTKLIVRVFFRKSKTAAPMPETTLEIDALAHDHQQAVLNLAHLERRRIQEILVPWSEVTSVRLSDSADEIVQVIFASGHTRLPVMEGETLTGILHTKEFLAYRENGGQDWKAIIRPAIRVHAADAALTTLRLMQIRRSHMAVVFGKAHELLGIVTMEDVLEEFLGDVMDEDDQSFLRKVFAERVKRRRIEP